MSLPVPRRLARDDLAGDWAKDVDTLSDALGDFQDATVQALAGGLTSANTTSSHAEYDLVHNVETRIKAPIGGRVLGCYAIGCTGVRVDSSGKPTRELYALDMPAISWRYGTEGLIVKATYPQTTGLIGEMLGPISRVRSNALALTTTTPVNVATTTSLTLTPGEWVISGAIGIDPAATTVITLVVYGITLTSATLPGADTIAVPTLGEVRYDQNYPAGYVPVNEVTWPIAPYRVTVAAGATMPLYLFSRADFATSTAAVYGSMEARRVAKTDAALRGRVRLYFFGG